jgi:hypothetical protein
MVTESERLRCFQCKLSIKDEDLYRLTWVGKTWEMTMNYHVDCLIKAVQDGDLKAQRDHNQQG